MADPNNLTSSDEESIARRKLLHPPTSRKLLSAPLAAADTEERTSSRPVELRETLAIERILVALDASKHSQAVLEIAAELAAKFHSEIRGLFIEDINLLRLEELPFVREVLFQRPIARQLESGEIARNLKARAAIIRHDLKETAERYQIQSTFQVVRGPVDAELLAAALNVDLLAVGQLGHSVFSRSRLGSTARAAIYQATSSVLLVRPELDVNLPVLVLVDGSPVSRRAVAAAVQLAGQSGDLRVLIWGMEDEEAYAERQAISMLLEPSGIKAEYQHIQSANPAVILELIKKQSGGVLVFGTTEAILPDSIIPVLLEEAPQHVLIVR